MFGRKAKSLVMLGALLISSSLLAADRTPLRTGWNLFTNQQDVELGRALVQDAENSLVFSSSEFAHGYINAVGQKLSVFAPGYKYPYEFRIYMDPAINSMALPGGVVYISSGMVLAAQTEPQLAALVAHQIAHVAARHGTQQVSRAYADETNTNRGRISVPDAMSVLDLRLDPDSVVLKYSAEAEQQADIIATQMLYDARWDPTLLPTMFQRLTNQQQNRSREFLDSHPTPLNRGAAVQRELRSLGPLPTSWRADSPDLRTTQQALRDESNSSFNDRITDNGRINNDRINNDRINNDRISNVPLPSNRTVIYQGPDYEFRYPDNWKVMEEWETITVSPNGGVVSGSLAYGMMVSTFQPQGAGFLGQNSFNVPGQRPLGVSTLSSATDQLINDLRSSNRNMRVVRTDQRRIAGQQALVTELNNDSPLGGREVDRLYTVLGSNGLLYYFLGVAPQRDASRYQPVFDQIMSSVRFY